ncbi:hypothetical protein MNEG_13144, partial [Monoraphidium neglectum]
MPAMAAPQRRAPRCAQNRSSSSVAATQRALRALAPLALLTILALAPCGGPVRCSAAPLSTVHSISQMWEQTALSAAEATLVAISKQTGRDLSLRAVPLDSLKGCGSAGAAQAVFVGRQHLISLEVDGVEYKLSFNSDLEGGGLDDSSSSSSSGGKGSSARTRGGGGALGLAAGGGSSFAAMQQQLGQQALPAGQASAGAGAAALARAGGAPGAQQALALPSLDPLRWQRSHVSLPEITLAGPLELVFAAPTPLALYLPHSVEAPAARRLLIAPGAALTLRNIRGVALRRPVELPKLPPSYLAEVLAHAQLGQPEPGFEGAPGMLYLA